MPVSYKKIHYQKLLLLTFVQYLIKTLDEEISRKKLTQRFPVNGVKWHNRIASSSFRDWQDIGRAKTGYISLQDHGDKSPCEN